MDALLTVPEVARRLRISRSLAYQLVARREIPAIRISARTVRVRPGDLERYVASRIASTPSACMEETSGTAGH